MQWRGELVEKVLAVTAHLLFPSRGHQWLLRIDRTLALQREVAKYDETFVLTQTLTLVQSAASLVCLLLKHYRLLLN